jgi:hypothetical protein
MCRGWVNRPKLRFALSRGVAISGLILGDATRGGARKLACPGLHILNPLRGSQFAALPTAAVKKFSSFGEFCQKLFIYPKSSHFRGFLLRFLIAFPMSKKFVGGCNRETREPHEREFNRIERREREDGRWEMGDGGTDGEHSAREFATVSVNGGRSRAASKSAAEFVGWSSPG